MTKTEYREYIASEDWQRRRKEYLSQFGDCNRCLIPRWLASIAYDQDLNVHHKNYQHLGSETPDDLEALCRRCHEIETFGRSDLRAIPSRLCEGCGLRFFDPYSAGHCDACNYFLIGAFPYGLLDKWIYGHRVRFWERVLVAITVFAGPEEIIDSLARNERDLRERHARVGGVAA